MKYLNKYEKPRLRRTIKTNAESGYDCFPGSILPLLVAFILTLTIIMGAFAIIKGSCFAEQNSVIYDKSEGESV